MKTNITAKASTIINAPASKVWEWLTKPELIKQYFFGTNTVTDWKPGSPIIFRGEWEGKTYEDKGTVLKNETNKVIQYNYWSSMSGTEDKPENYANVTYELLEENNKTTLTVTQDNVANEKAKEHSEQNWKMILDGMKNLLEKSVKAV